MRKIMIAMLLTLTLCLVGCAEAPETAASLPSHGERFADVDESSAPAAEKAEEAVPVPEIKETVEFSVTVEDEPETAAEVPEGEAAEVETCEDPAEEESCEESAARAETEETAIAPEEEIEKNNEDSDSEGPEISDEELQVILEHYHAWLAEKERQTDGGEICYDIPQNDIADESSVWIVDTRSEEETYQFISNFVANYKNTESFRSLDEEGIEYLEDCLNLLNTDPASDENIACYMEKYQSGFYDDEMFNFMLECWVEFAGPFGEGCVIYVY